MPLSLVNMEEIQKTLVSVQSGLQKGDPTAIGIVVAVVIGILTLVALIVKSAKKSKRQGILLLGVSDSGKTLLFSQLVFKTFKETCSSVQANIGDYVIPERKKQLKVLDLPGNERIRGQQIEEHKGSARAVMFIIDSSSFQKEIKEVAEFLYTLLSDKTVSSNSIPVLILCNKQDLTLSKGSKVIRKQLEKEMNTLRKTKAATLQGVDDSSGNNVFLGKKDKDFDFDDLRPIRVDFAEGSAQGNNRTSGNPQLEEVYKWLSNVA